LKEEEKITHLKCNKCKDTGRIRPDQVCWYNCELGGDCDGKRIDCFFCGTIKCDCGIELSKNSYYSEIEKRIVYFED
jgi:hypothetical protein